MRIPIGTISVPRKDVDTTPVTTRGRDAFLYMEAEDHDFPGVFAQCSACCLWLPGQDMCAIHGPAFHADADDSCGLFIAGLPFCDGSSMIVTPEESGFVRRPTRCENCLSFDRDRSVCQMFEALDGTAGFDFSGDCTVKPKACCNGQLPAMRGGMP